jgi:histidine ammonia-lyase
MAPVAARRLAEQVAIGFAMAAIELTVAAQAAELRGRRAGRGTAAATNVVRRFVPFLRVGDRVSNVDALTNAIAVGEIAALVRPEAGGPDVDGA